MPGNAPGSLADRRYSLLAVFVAGLVPLALRAVRVASCGLPQDTGEYRDGDNRDYRQNKQTNYGKTQEPFLPRGYRDRRALPPDGSILTHNRYRG